MKTPEDYIKQECESFEKDIVNINGIQMLPVTDVKAHLYFVATQAQMDAYNQALEDVIKSIEIKQIVTGRIEGGNSYNELGYCVDEESILKLKK